MMVVAHLRKHMQLVPLVGCIGVGMVAAFGYIFRMAAFSPDVCINKHKHPYPWQTIKPNQQYKFYAVGIDYKNLQHPRPELD